MTNREPECVALKRRGAARIYQQLAGKSPAEQLAFWQKRNLKVRARQEAKLRNETPALPPGLS